MDSRVERGHNVAGLNTADNGQVAFRQPESTNPSLPNLIRQSTATRQKHNMDFRIKRGNDVAGLSAADNSQAAFRLPETGNPSLPNLIRQSIGKIKTIVQNIV